MSRSVMPIMSIGYNYRDEIAEMRRAGVTNVVIAVPWWIIAPHEAQAQRNHGRQTLERLAERGGLSACEAVAILENRDHSRMPRAAANERLRKIVAEAERRARDSATPGGILSRVEQKVQGARCSCKGTDEFCPCQNVPDAETRRLRMEAMEAASEEESTP